MTSYAVLVIVNLAVSIIDVQSDNVTLVMLVPITGSRSYGYQLHSVAELAISHLNSDMTLTGLRNNDVQFQLVVEDTACDTGHGMFALVDTILRSRNTIGAFIGTFIIQSHNFVLMFEYITLHVCHFVNDLSLRKFVNSVIHELFTGFRRII